MMKIILILISIFLTSFLTGCVTIYVQNCDQLENGDLICELKENPFCPYRLDC